MTFSRRRRRMYSGVAVADRQEEAPTMAEPAELLDPETPRTLPAPAAGDRLPIAVPTFEAEHPAPAGWPIWLVATAAASLWALAPLAFAVGYRNQVAPLHNDPFALMVFALLAIGPAAFVFGAAYMMRQGQKLAYENRRSEAMAHSLLTPTLAASARAGDLAQAVREEILRAGQAAEEARDTLLALREAMAFETDKLTGATAQSVRTANELAATLGRERAEMSGLAQTLDAQAVRVADAITQQARMVADATGLAEAQIREAETALASRAADLAAAAGEASQAARVAGEDLTRHIARLETAGVGVAEQVRAVEGGLNEQRAALATLTQTLRDDHEGFAASADAHSARLGEFIEHARASADAMSERAAAGGDALRQLMTDATAQFRGLAAAATAEREAFGQSTVHALQTVSDAAAEQRTQLEAQTRAAIEALARAAEETRAAAASHAAAARDQVDQLSEAAFGAGQKANQVFEARLDEARALIEHSSKMVEDAGATTARKLADGAAAARATMDELGAMLAELDQRAARLPVTARGQAEQVRAAVAGGMDELMAQARRTAEEAQAIDAAFQQRVRRNFEMLSEAVRLMGVAAVAAPAPPAATPVSEAPVVEPPPAAPATPPGSERVGPERVGPEPVAVEPVAAEPVEAEPVGVEPVAAEAPGAALADQIGLRHRIRLTPTATDREFSAVFEAAGGPPAAAAAAPGEDADEGESWTWKDLLASLDSADAGGERLEDLLGDELSRMGVEPHQLLPKGRVDDIAAALQTGDVEGSREVVRKLAPAATRRIARRLFTDEEVKRRAEVYVRRYKTLIDDAVGRDREGFALAELLDARGGRVFLLLDAAAGDML